MLLSKIINTFICLMLYQILYFSHVAVLFLLKVFLFFVVSTLILQGPRTILTKTKRLSKFYDSQIDSSYWYGMQFVNTARALTNQWLFGGGGEGSVSVNDGPLKLVSFYSSADYHFTFIYQMIRYCFIHIHHMATT